MTLKMQWEDAVSSFSFLFPAHYSPVEDAICPAGQPQGAGAGSVAGGQPVDLQRSPRELGGGYSSCPTPNLPWRCLPPLPMSGTRDVKLQRTWRCLGCPSSTGWEKAKRTV